MPKQALAEKRQDWGWLFSCEMLLSQIVPGLLHMCFHLFCSNCGSVTQEYRCLPHLLLCYKQSRADKMSTADKDEGTSGRCCDETGHMGVKATSWRKHAPKEVVWALRIQQQHRCSLLCTQGPERESCRALL